MKKLAFISFLMLVMGFFTPLFIYTAHADSVSLLFPSYAVSNDGFGNVSVAFTSMVGGSCYDNTGTYNGITVMTLYKGTYPDLTTPVGSRNVDSGGSPISGHPQCVWNSVFQLSSGDGTGTFANYPFGAYTYTYTTGDYWLKFGFGFSSVQDFYVPLYYDAAANVWTLTPSDTGHIQTMVLPTAGASTTTTVTFQGTYFNSANYTEICAVITGQDGYNGSQCDTLGLVVGTDMPYSFTATLPNNQTYTYYLELKDIDFGYESDHSQSVSFKVGMGSSISTGGYTPEPCSWSDFSTWGGCFSNTIYALFYPSSDSLSQFNTLYVTYRTKPPFGYINAIQQTLTSINDTGTSAFTLQTMPVLNTYIFTPLRVAFTWILWLGFAFLLFKRFKDIQL